MLSRVANSIYWMRRYIERAENIARFIDANLHLTLDRGPGTEEQWKPLVLTLSDLPLFEERYDEATRANVIEFLTFDAENPNSILSCLKAARENARIVRDAISSEMWEQVNTFYLFVAAGSYRDFQAGDTHSFFTRIKTQAHLFNGITANTMSHSEGWHFGQLGRQLERADKTCRLLDVKYFIMLPSVTEVGSPFDALQWEALLRSASAFEMFRKRHGRVTPDKVAEFLLLDREFPRAICHCLCSAQESLHAITGSRVGTFNNTAEQQLGLVVSQLNFARIEEIISFGLHEFLDRVQVQLNQIGDAIFDKFIAQKPLDEPSSHQRPLLVSSTVGNQFAGGTE